MAAEMLADTIGGFCSRPRAVVHPCDAARFIAPQGRLNCTRVGRLAAALEQFIHALSLRILASWDSDARAVFPFDSGHLGRGKLVFRAFEVVVRQLPIGDIASGGEEAA